MYVRKDPKFANVIYYMDGKLKEYCNEKSTVKNITFKQCEEFFKKVTQDHSEEELFLLEDSLEIETDMYKQSGFKQTTLSIWSSILVGTTVAIFTFYNTYVQTLFNVFGKSVIDNSKNKENAINEMQKVYNESFDISLNQVATFIFYPLLFVISAMCMYTVWSHNRAMKKRLFYYKIIKRCIELKKKQDIGQEIKEVNNNVVSA
ncbi:hypothetical protein ABWK26_25135 [Bacillus toyonensis]|uniref:hypothetical protein n=1 Tax=Bacillus toyonensis TaxID=155322 RepID=UPI000BEC42B9|nr:hypothetical protein [Bacillus toyonensis]PED17428.1 hypothetical protein CON63_26065 [Bacillus toyonensis]PFZ72479.1 hypothetical protein COL72_11720 [Bacillus toyonensis]HDR3908355.1 hypothetical protein [Bacillus toyonensis]HDR7408326.1 hypothetical protein [Bacillus toyonensis]